MRAGVQRVAAVLITAAANSEADFQRPVGRPRRRTAA